MSLRTREHPPRGTYTRDHFHGRYICSRCSAEVHDWQVHTAWHDELDEMPGQAEAAEAPEEDLSARARAEGAAVVEFTRPRMFGRETWRQVAACVHPRRFRSPLGRPGGLSSGRVSTR